MKIQSSLIAAAAAIFSVSCLIALAQEKAPEPRVVVLDPGHGGRYIPGKTDGTQRGDGSSWNNTKSPKKGILEKDLTLEYALEIKKAFEASARAKGLNIKVVLTRYEDKHMSALSRAAVAVQQSADVFISLHFNASGSHRAHGTKVFISSEKHPYWEYVNFNNPYAKEDRAFAHQLADAVAGALEPFGGDPENRYVHGDSKGDGGFFKDGLRMLGYARQDSHLYQAVMNLIEIEFIDNPRVESWLLSEETRPLARKAVALSMVDAICDHFENFTPPSAPRKARY